MNSKSTWNEWTLRASLRENSFAKVFMAIWLLGWAVAEVFTLRSIAPHAGWVIEHWREVFPAINRVGSVTYPIAADNRDGQLFAAGWLVGWTVAGVVTGGTLLWMLFGRDTILLNATDLIARSHLGPFGRTSRGPRSSIKLLTVTPNGHALVAETTARRWKLATFGTRAERERVAAELQAALEAPATAIQSPDVSPEGWTRSTTSDGWTELVRSPQVFQPAVLQGTWAVALLIAAAAPEMISPLSFLHGMPQLFALFGAGSAAFSAYGTLGNTSRLRLRAHELVVASGYPVTLGQQSFSHPLLSVTCDKGKGSTEVYTLWAEKGGQRAKLLVSGDRATPALELGEWLAKRLDVKLLVPDELVRI